MKPIDDFQKKITKIISDTTKESKIKLDIISYDLSENIETQETFLKNCLIKIQNLSDNQYEDATIIFNNEGKGFVDSLYKGIIRELNLFSTLADFSVNEFKIIADTKNNISTEGKAIAQLTIQNNLNKEEFVFHSLKTFSINVAAIDVIIEALEFFINAEQSIKLIHRALNDAKKRHRQDLVEKYINNMSLLTRITSYSKIVEKERKGK